MNSQKLSINPSLLSPIFFILLLANVLGAALQSSLRYQDRGDRYEGVRPSPVDLRFKLISAMVDYKEKESRLPDQIKLRFYLKQQTPVFVSVRELENRRDYVMDTLKPTRGWPRPFINEFQWSTEEVIKPLNLQLYDLGALVQLGNDYDGLETVVSPALLYYSQLPSRISGYSFAFEVSRFADVTYWFISEDNPTLRSQGFLPMRGRLPGTVNWDATNAPEGWYRLEIKAVYADHNQDLKVIHFYHTPSMVGEAATPGTGALQNSNTPKSGSEDTVGVFSSPVRLTEKQTELLSTSAKAVNRREESLKTTLAKLEPKASFTLLKELLITTLSEAKRDIESDQGNFISPMRGVKFIMFSRDKSDLQAARMFFGEMLARYDAELAVLKNAQSKDYTSIRTRTLQLLETNELAYSMLARSGDLTFNLEVASSPQGASISYKRKGDNDYTSEGSQTKTTLQNLGYAIWFVRAELAGFKIQEKSHDPFREPNHVLTFELEKLSTTSPSLNGVKSSDKEPRLTAKINSNGNRNRARASIALREYLR